MQEERKKQFWNTCYELYETIFYDFDFRIPNQLDQVCVSCNAWIVGKYVLQTHCNEAVK
jgi:hypothetical protein